MAMLIKRQFGLATIAVLSIFSVFGTDASGFPARIPTEPIQGGPRLNAALRPFLINRAQGIDFSLITRGRRAAYHYDALTGEGSMQLRTGPDRHLQNLGDPSVCPSSSSIELRIAGSATTYQEDATPFVELPCENWQKLGGGYRYRDPSGSAGGITSIHYRKRGLKIRAESPGYTPVPGPFAFTQIRFNVEDTNYMIRLNGFRVNTESLVKLFVQSRAAEKAEAGFWDTLWNVDYKPYETIALAEKATKKRKNDARAYFLAGMMRAYLATIGIENYLDAGPEQIELLQGMVYNMDIAMEMLWDGTTGDSRGLGFLSGGRYELGVLLDDPAIIAQAELELVIAASDNPLFSTFTPLGAVGPRHHGNSPEYQALIQLIDDYFLEAALPCLSQGELCFNDGLGPQNLQGTLTFFADIYTKGNRRAVAAEQLALAVELGELSGWDPAYIAGAQDRLDNLDARIALFQDNDPSNDPAVLGFGGLGLCAWCHNR